MTIEEYKKWLIKKLQDMKREKHKQFDTINGDDEKLFRLVGSMDTFTHIINFLK